MGDHCWIVTGMARWTETTDSCFTNCSTQKAFCSGVAIIALLRHRQRERRGEWDCACAQNLDTCCSLPCGKLTSACVLKAVRADWNCSNHFDTPCILTIKWRVRLNDSRIYNACPAYFYDFAVHSYCLPKFSDKLQESLQEKIQYRLRIATSKTFNHRILQNIEHLTLL